MNTVPDKCPFCELPVRVHCGNPIKSKDGRFATYECKTAQDVDLNNGEWRRYGQSKLCRERQVQILTKQRDEACERIKRLEDIISRASRRFFRNGSNGMVARGMLAILEEGRNKP